MNTNIKEQESIEESINVDKITFDELIELRFEASINYASAKATYHRLQDGADGEKVAIIGMEIDVQRKEAGLSALGRNERLDAAKSSKQWSEYLDLKRDAEYWYIYYEGLIKKYDDAYEAKRTLSADRRKERY